MRVSVYVDEGVEQLVLTPETDFEKNVVEKFGDRRIEASIMYGHFYPCQGGWVRQYDDTPKSLIIRNKEEPNDD